MKCNDQIKYLERDYLPRKKDGIKYKKGKRCKKCNYKICYINNQLHCWICWCLRAGPGFYNSSHHIGDKNMYFQNNIRSISKYNHYPCETISYGKYSGKMLAFILQQDFNYCKWLIHQKWYNENSIKLKNMVNDIENNIFGEI